MTSEKGFTVHWKLVTPDVSLATGNWLLATGHSRAKRGKMFGPLIIKPCKSKGEKTGFWRIKLKPKFLQKNCIACKVCVLICPEGCIQGKDKNTYISNYEYCKGCGLCAQVCPKQDIEMVEEE